MCEDKILSRNIPTTVSSTVKQQKVTTFQQSKSSNQQEKVVVFMISVLCNKNTKEVSILHAQDK